MSKLWRADDRDSPGSAATVDYFTRRTRRVKGGARDGDRSSLDRCSVPPLLCGPLPTHGVDMIVGVATEGTVAERRVALVPLSVRELSRADLAVVVQRGAGAGAGYPDADYESRGARLLSDAAEVASTADILVCVRPDGLRIDALRRGHIVIGLLDPLGSPATMQQLAAAGVTSFALELLPRSTRAYSGCKSCSS